jgi:hypothetical protein
MQFSILLYSVPVKSKRYPQLPTLRCPHVDAISTSILFVGDRVSHPYKITGSIIVTMTTRCHVPQGSNIFGSGVS